MLNQYNLWFLTGIEVGFALVDTVLFYIIAYFWLDNWMKCKKNGKKHN